MKTFKVSEKNVNLTATFIFGSFSSKISFILAKSAREHTFLKNYGRGRDTRSEMFKPFLLQIMKTPLTGREKSFSGGGSHSKKQIPLGLIKYHLICKEGGGACFLFSLTFTSNVFASSNLMVCDTKSIFSLQTNFCEVCRKYFCRKNFVEKKKIPIFAC